jgi:hypothetical protein
LVDVFLVGLVVGSTFSFSGSSNLTVFLTAGLVSGLEVVVAMLDARAGRPRVVFLTGAGAVASSVAVFLVVRVVLAGFTGSTATGSAAFLGLPRLRTAVAGAGSGTAGSDAGSSTATFLGRPRPRVVFDATVVIFLAGCISWLSSSSSDGLFLLTAVLVVVIEVVVEVVLRAVLALAAAVTTRVGFAAGSDVFAAARARVILFGGDCASMVVGLWCVVVIGGE